MDLKGKNEKSLPVPQYFSWINNCNEGSNEQMTLSNLDFFKWLEDEFGMKIEIYALDAGNFDSPQDNYFDSENKMWKKNFPDGFENIVKRAKEYGITFGIWAVSYTHLDVYKRQGNFQRSDAVFFYNFKVSIRICCFEFIIKMCIRDRSVI